MIKANHTVNPGGETGCGIGGEFLQQKGLGENNMQQVPEAKPLLSSREVRDHSSRHRATIKHTGKWHTAGINTF